VSDLGIFKRLPYLFTVVGRLAKRVVCTDDVCWLCECRCVCVCLCGYVYVCGWVGCVCECS